MLMQIQGILRKCINCKLAISCILTCSLAVTTSAWAGYKPPVAQKPPSGKTSSHVARSGGCQSNKGPSLTALAPYSHIGQTVSTHPTFAWFVPDAQSYPMEFRLYQYNADRDAFGKLHQDTKIQTVKLQSQPGIMTLTLPEGQPGLSVRQQYRWQVVVLCNPNSPSNALEAEADIEFVEASPALQRGLSTTSDSREKADLYAESGLWYDAFSEALAGIKDATTREFNLMLLSELAGSEETEELKELEETEELANGNTQSARLRKVIQVNGSMLYQGSSH